MIGDITTAGSIYIVCGYTDMRKSVMGLCSIIKEKLATEVENHTIYLFCGKRCDRIKILMKEPDGFVLIYKLLSVEGKYKWPRNSSEVKPLSWKQLDWLLSGLDIEQPKAIGMTKNTKKKLA